MDDVNAYVSENENSISAPNHRFAKSEEYFRGLRSDLFSMIPVHCRTILDVGCGAGEFWRSFPAEVTGVELNESAARKARLHMKQVFSMDIEENALPVDKKSFDCIIFADVLEHLYDPWGVVSKYREYLRNEGLLLISIPNIRNYRVVRSLVFKGEFKYEESGILDIDHVRFFTRKEILKLLDAAGFDVIKVQNKYMASSKYIFINRLFCGIFSDFLTGQFYILAKARTH